MNSNADHPSLQCVAVARAAFGENLSQERHELLWRCPNHNDQHPSLKINIKKNNWMCGPCGAGGNAWQLAAFLAGVQPSNKAAVAAWLRERGLLSRETKQSRKLPKADRGAIIREHVYVNEISEPLAKKIRWGSLDPQEDKKLKHFSWQRWDAGRWVNGLDAHKQASLPLYRIDRIKNLPEGAAVVLCEGEHDADAGAEIGLATTTTGGTGTFPTRHAEWFRDKDVIIVSHADEPGRVEAQKRAALLHGIAACVKVVELPGCKDLAESVNKGMPRDAFIARCNDAPEWRPDSGANLLDGVFRFVQRYVSLSESQARVVTLWILHTYCLDAAYYTPYLAITSAEKQCGKSRLLEVLEAFAWNPLRTASISPSALYRAVEKWKPTLLIDEADAAFRGNRETIEALRGVLNAGFQRGLYAVRSVGQGTKMEPEKFSTFGAKAIAAIGEILETVGDRSIPIEMKRAVPGTVPDWQIEKLEKDIAGIKVKLSLWASTNAGTLKKAEPERLPAPDFWDRQENISKPLRAIADAAGGDWPQAGRQAIIALFSQARPEVDNMRLTLLKDIRNCYYVANDDGSPASFRDWISSQELAGLLTEMEGRPWPQFGKLQKPITPNDLASKRLLGHYKISPQQRRIPADPNGKRERGYAREQFEEVWGLYLSPTLNREAMKAKERLNNGEVDPIVEPLVNGARTRVSAEEPIDIRGGPEETDDAPSQPLSRL
jgi:hypothetical protein